MEKEGDCDTDWDCYGNLTCGRENCPSLPSFEVSDDCCRDPNKCNLKHIQSRTKIYMHIPQSSGTSKATMPTLLYGGIQ